MSTLRCFSSFLVGEETRATYWYISITGAKMTLSKNLVKNCDGYMATGVCVHSEDVCFCSQQTNHCLLPTDYAHAQSQHIPFALIFCTNLKKKQQSLYICFIFLTMHLWEQTLCLLFDAEAAHQNCIFLQIIHTKTKQCVFGEAQTYVCVGKPFWLYSITV